MQNFEPRIMPYVRKKIANDEEMARIVEYEKKKQALFKAYEQIDRIFGKPLSAFQVVTVVSFRTITDYDNCDHSVVMFTIDDFTFHYEYRAGYHGGFFLSSKPEKHRLRVKSKVWYRRWYDTHYSAKRFMQLVESGKI